MLVSEAFIKYEVTKLMSGPEKTRKNYRCALNSFIKACGDIPVELVGYHTIEQWKTYGEYMGSANSYMASNVSRLKQVFKFLKRCGCKVIDCDAIERPVVKQNSNPVWLEPYEVAAILSVIASPRDKAIFALLFSSGARISELLSLNRDSIQDGRAKIIGKGDKPGIIRFDPNALAILYQYLSTRNDECTPLFISGQMSRITVSRVEQLAHEYADKAGITKNFTPHVARHTFASGLKLNGADIFDIKEQLRHDRISSTQIYVHIGESQRDKDYARYHTPIPVA